jgi:peptidyl-prolyl cis-trans isomerase D
MLRGLRKASSNWVGKSIMAAVVGLLAISFAIWGIGDIFRGSTRTAVAKIGSTEITGEQFRQLFNDRLQQLSRQIGRPVTPAQARALGFDQRLLAQLLSEAALDDRVRVLRLGISDAEVARRIRQDPGFQGITGTFDRSRFEQMIRNAGYSEQRFVAEQRKISLRRQLAEAITGNTPVPGVEIEAFNRHDGETRGVDYIVLGEASAGEIGTPSPEVLQKYFDDRKITFRAPEYRKVVLLVLNPAEIGKSIEISEADAKRIYEDRLARYSTPEKREVQQMIFPNEEDAKKAAEQIEKGAWFEVVASERGFKLTDINLGLVDKSAIVDKAIADAAFSLRQGDTSAPVAGRFGVALVRVVKIEPARTPTFAEVEADIKKDLAAERAKTQVTALRDKIEDELAGGARLDEVAQKTKLQVRTIDAIDRSGRSPDGNSVELPPGADVLSGVFATQVGVENDPAQAGGGFIWYEVGGVTPARDRTMEDVKDRIAERWREDEIASRLKAKATEMVDKLKSGTPISDVAAASKLKIETAKDVKRRGTEALSQPAAAAIFKTAKGTAATADGKQSGEQIVFVVTEVSTPAFDANSPESKRISDQLRSALADELLTQYVARVENDLGTTINRTALNQAILGGSGQ